MQNVYKFIEIYIIIKINSEKWEIKSEEYKMLRILKEEETLWITKEEDQ